MSKQASAPFVILLLSVSVLSGQIPVYDVLAFMRENSVYRNTVDWENVSTAFSHRLQNAHSADDTMQCLVYVLETLDDVHSQLYFNHQYFGHYHAFEDSTLARIRPLNDLAVEQTNQITSSLLDNDIGYISVPSFHISAQDEIDRFAQELYNTVTFYRTKSVIGYIIDLRLNGGGNLYPMVAGLSALLGDTIVGHEVDPDGHRTRTWEIRDGNFVIGGHRATAISSVQSSGLETIPVVLLIGPVTRSAGSMTAIAFRGRPRTICIGESTANGYTTSNGFFVFTPSLYMHFATHFIADRHMQIYQTVVDPDITIRYGDDFSDLLQDEKISEAIRWLRQSGLRD